MKKVLVASLAALVLSLALTAGAQAKCNLGCLNRKVRSLGASLAKAEKTIAAQSQAITQLSGKANEQDADIASQGQTINFNAQVLKGVKTTLACLVEVPITQYGQPEGPLGYLVQFENEAEELETAATTALDVTYPEDFVSGWAVFDSCNTSEVALGVSSSAIAPIGELPTYTRAFP